MLLALIITQLSVLVIANPFHKYPTVFLLDVGNEELEKTNTEQIRVSVPGGSIALRYPAIGDGNTIGHLRVSSIDFGTSFKANIVDGGPGYKYAVLVLMGNPGVPYDAVVTVQTVNDQAYNIPNIGYYPNSSGGDAEVNEDENNSAEDMSDDGPPATSYQSESVAQSTNAEVMQSSVNVYKYAENENMDQSDDDYRNSDDDDDVVDVEENRNEESAVEEDDNEETAVEGDDNEESAVEGDDNEESDSDVNEADNESIERVIHKEYINDVDQTDDSSFQVQGIDTDDADNDEEVSPELAQSIPNDFEEDNEVVVRSRIDSNYDRLRPYLSGGQIYYEDNQKRPDYQREPLDYESPDEVQQIFNDGEIHNNGDKYRDSNNNNYIDSDDNYAVAYK
ncbi:hypothetical protein PYW08_008123 [Mythimna loreyi]|uniref:Uncharacterized protein n=1 Tax=Mythimna loreyi TaxID=667449 RepID=A0ACC2QAG7_9NEOP|nr:hypothetical protein PYW08_008123 [Mythimna loreyi]